MSMLEHRRNEEDTRPTRTKIELIATKRAIAIGKLVEFERQCMRLAHLIAEGGIDRADAADGLFDAAEANGLIEVHGQDHIQLRVASAFELVGLELAFKGRAT
ncbi:hypothetical protein [Tardiphaga robiniae]|uniref:Uncharacterized protein n=1 Tax=Tardiphaga robiniae TaxID=943830 RepID=A0A163ZV73_9BRAD|nr:hypothetical protein [Tardiphaga robiniae]KZD23899.1 hypothetical protein A4A58_25205 [Tardiphaga robiniae]